MKRIRRPSGQGSLFKRPPGRPWIASWFDHNGKRRERSTRTTDRRASERILAKQVADEALRRDGIIDSRKDRFSDDNRKHFVEQIRAYIGHCRHAGHAPRHVDQKDAHLMRLQKSTGAARFSDLTVDPVEHHMRHLIGEGLSDRTANFARQITVAFMSWCVNDGACRIEHTEGASKARRRTGPPTNPTTSDRR